MQTADQPQASEATDSPAASLYPPQFDVDTVSRDTGAHPSALQEIQDRAMVARRWSPDEARAKADEAKALLREHFGAGADRALADARALAGRNPQMRRFLEHTGTGNDPQTVLRLAQLAAKRR